MSYKDLTKKEKEEIAEHIHKHYRQELKEIREGHEYPEHHMKHDIEHHTKKVEAKLKKIAGF